ncbi:MAG: hypothetical protein AAGK32_19900 [Actinomycetota bacterium]
MADRAGRAAAALVAAVLVLTACGDSDPSDEEAQKAAELQEALADLDIEVTDQQLVTLYADDGGTVCAAADDPDKLATYSPQVPNHFGLRRIRALEEDIAFDRAVIATYCPQHLDRFDEHVDSLRTGEEN